MVDRTTGEMFLSAAGLEKLDPAQRAQLLGMLATDYGLRDIKVTEKKKQRKDIKKEAAQMVQNLPSDVDYGYFSYDDLLSFMQARYASEEGANDRTIGRRASVLWNYLITGGYNGYVGQSRGNIAAVIDPSLPEKTISLEEAIISMHAANEWQNQQSRDRILRESLSLSLNDVVSVLKIEAQIAMRDPAYYGLGAQAFEHFALFAASRIPASEVNQ